ncbi:MAG: universal stress protein [Candidatus Methanomethylophilaceae archaeon]|nr:universal stress protein [Candidatus Methanomethylophilaceae archaeon]
MSILLAYDGKPSSETALDYSVKYANNFDEPLYILTVVSREQMDPDDPDESVREYMEAAQQKASSEGIDAHTIIEVGKPSDKVLEIADSYKCGTLILGRSDRSTIDRKVMGSVSDSAVKYFKGTIVIVSDDRI